MQRFLVIALAGIGDTLMATPFLHELRENYPDATVDALVLWPGARQVLTGNPHVGTVFQHNFIRASKLASLRFVLGLRRRRYDASFNVHPQARTEYRLIARLIGARRRFSHRYDRWSWLDERCVTDSVPQDYAVHAHENNLQLLALAGRSRRLTEPRYELTFAEPELKWAVQFLQEHSLLSQRWLGLHVGSGGTKNLALRRWPLERYQELAQRLAQHLPGLPLVFFGGPEEAEPHAALFQQLRGSRAYFPTSPSVRHAAALLAHAHAFLSVDTLFMHLAAAVQVPHQFVIQTPTVNPPILPLRSGWHLIPNDRVGDRALEFYRYDGGPIRGTDAELRDLMASVSAETVEAQLRQHAFA